MATTPAMEKRGSEQSLSDKGLQAQLELGQPGLKQNATIDAAAEARLRRKIDWHIMPIVMLMYLWCFIDRANIGNARLYNLEKDLGMSGYDFNVAQTCFYISYVLFEYPVVMLVKVIGGGRWIPFLVFMFGVMSLCTSFVHNFGQLCGLRFLLGLFESGLLPGLAYFLSRWYRKGELVFRISLYICMAPLAGAFGGLLAYGIVKDVSHIGWLTSWRELFFVEGLTTIGVGAAAGLLLSSSPETAPWLSQEEKALALARIRADAVDIPEAFEPTRAQTMKSGIFTLHTWALGLIFLFNSQCVQGIAVFLPTIITAQFPTDTAIRRNLLTVPPFAVGLVWVLLMNFLAWKTRRHGLFCVLSAPFAVLGYAFFLVSGNTHIQYAGAFFVAMGSFSFGALLNGWLCANLAPDATRASGVAFGAFLQNIGGLISNWIYLAPAAPKYTAGHSVNIGFSVLQLVLSAIVWLYFIRENRLRRKGARDHRLEGKTPEQIALLGHRHPRFVYTY